MEFRGFKGNHCAFPVRAQVLIQFLGEGESRDLRIKVDAIKIWYSSRGPISCSQNLVTRGTVKLKVINRIPIFLQLKL